MGPRGYFMHRRLDDSPKGGVTAYFKVEEEAPGRYKVSYSSARCNPIDNFTKRIGRSVAQGRFEKRRRREDVIAFFVENPDPEAVRELVITAMEVACKAELESIRDIHIAHCDALLRKYATLIRRGAITS